MSTYEIPGEAGTPPPIPPDPRERQRHAMRWILLAVVVVLVMGWAASGIVYGPSVRMAAVGFPVIGIFAWLVRDQFGP